MSNREKTLTPTQQEELLTILRERFEKNIERHPGLNWDEIQERLLKNPNKLWSLNEMEKTGGEVDVIGFDNTTNEYLFCDCAKETPVGRRNTCYDEAARVARKKFPPENSAIEMASAMGIEILTEEEYRALQELGEFDLKTSSWIKTPEEIRKLGGALFCDCRYNTVFVYHNGADSYYSVRGFRGLLRV